MPPRSFIWAVKYTLNHRPVVHSPMPMPFRHLLILLWVDWYFGLRFLVTRRMPLACDFFIAVSRRHGKDFYITFRAYAYRYRRFFLYRHISYNICWQTIFCQLSSFNLRATWFQALDAPEIRRDVYPLICTRWRDAKPISSLESVRTAILCPSHYWRAYGSRLPLFRLPRLVAERSTHSRLWSMPFH